MEHLTKVYLKKLEIMTKAEILVDFDINIDKKTNLSFLESTQELVVSLGDRQIFSEKEFNTYMKGNQKIINLLSVLYPRGRVGR